MPHAKDFDPSNPSAEAGFLELGVVVNNIRHVVICGKVHTVLEFHAKQIIQWNLFKIPTLRHY